MGTQDCPTEEIMEDENSSTDTYEEAVDDALLDSMTPDEDNSENSEEDK